MAPIRISALLQLPAHLRTATLIRSASVPTTRVSPSSTRCISTTKQYNAPDASPAPSHSSVNQTEVSHFNALASSWWDPHGSSRLLHLMNPLRHDFIRRCRGVDAYNPNQKLKYLDIGCGGGVFAESAARMAHTESVTAIDPTPEVIAVARRHQKQDPFLLEPGRLRYENTSIEQLPAPATPEEGFDIITLFEVVEHIQKPSPFLQSVLKHLKPGGWLIGSTIARTNTSWFTTKFMAEDVLGLVPKGTHEWSQYIQPNELWQWARVQPELEVGDRSAKVESNGWKVMGVVYVPGFGWKEVSGSEDWGNYFFGMRKRDSAD